MLMVGSAKCRTRIKSCTVVNLFSGLEIEVNFCKVFNLKLVYRLPACTADYFNVLHKKSKLMLKLRNVRVFSILGLTVFQFS